MSLVLACVVPDGAILAADRRVTLVKDMAFQIGSGRRLHPIGANAVAAFGLSFKDLRLEDLYLEYGASLLTASHLARALQREARERPRERGIGGLGFVTLGMENGMPALFSAAFGTGLEPVRECLKSGRIEAWGMRCALEGVRDLSRARQGIRSLFDEAHGRYPDLVGPPYDFATLRASEAVILETDAGGEAAASESDRDSSRRARVWGED